MERTALRALLTRSIDYAGLFPPATLDLATSIANQAAYLQTDGAWMLNTFVLPISEFDAAATQLRHFSEERPLVISALGPKSTSASMFISALKGAVDAIRAFNRVENPIAVVRQLEMPLPTEVDAQTLTSAHELLDEPDLRAFWEAPADDAEQTIDLLVQHRERFGFKLRTGGVKAEAFPPASQIASALAASVNTGVAIKFTAGLHHPVRMHRDEVNTKMHGFLNVLGAGVLAMEHKWDVARITTLLQDEEASNFRFTEHTFSWHEWAVTTDRIERHRELVTSFGSCSFDEPRQDLRDLALL
jgi:hypothetical protein